MRFRGSVKFIPGLAAWLVLTLVPTSTEAALPPDAQKLLESFPGKKVTIDLVVGRAIEASDSFRQVLSAIPGFEVAALQARAGLDYQAYAKASRVINQNEPRSPFEPNRLLSTSYTLGVSTAFRTGTTASFEFSHGDTDLRFPASPGNPGFTLAYFETQATLTLAQDLWENYFGHGTRSLVEAGDRTKDAARKEFQENVQAYVGNLVGIFYNAWLAQSQTLASKETADRRRRLLDATEVKLRRGTAESPDLNQARSTWLQAQAQVAQAAQVLGDRWRGLVTNLKLPEAWLTVDPAEIPIELDQPIDEALKVCGPEPMNSFPKKSAATERADLQAQAARLRADQAKNALMPDVELVGQIAANAIDPTDRGTTFGDAFKLQNPAWTVGVNVTVPIMNYAEAANARLAVGNQIRAEALASDAYSNLRLEWMNACADLARLERARDLLKKAAQSQAERARQEEERFRIGRGTLQMLIFAQDDAAAADLNHRSAEVEARLAAWRVRRLNDGLEKYLSSLGEKVGQLVQGIEP